MPVKKTKLELEAKNDLYKAKAEEWELYDLVFESGKPLITYALRRNPRETVGNWKNRLWIGYSFNFGKSIIEILNFYLCEKDVIRELEPLAKDKQWEAFKLDADLNGTDYSVFLDEAQKLASVFGSIGILCNKPIGAKTVAKELSAGAYPYYSLYSPLNIYDWQWGKDPVSHRRVLEFLKLYEGNNTYTFWYPHSWEQWHVHPKTGKIEIIAEGPNPLGEIPFVWMNNLRNFKTPEIGVSDVIDISHIVISIIQNLSCGEEMINLAGFPIRRQPMGKEGDEEGSDEVNTGPRAVEEFDPTLGKDGKPDWMPTEIKEPVEAALAWIDRKVDEIFRVAHLSGVHGQRKSNNEVASGMALRYEFTQLNTVLTKKSTNQNEAELQLLRLWLKWQGKESIYKDCKIKRSKDFSIDDLSIELENALMSINRVMSKTYRIKMQEKITKFMLPDLSADDIKTVKAEIKAGTPDKVEWEQETNNPTEHNSNVRSANESKADHSKNG